MIRFRYQKLYRNTGEEEENIIENIRGTNFGNWLVLEKWMKPDLFAASGTEDETWLCRKEKPDALRALLKEHRDTYITEDDFAYVASLGLNFVRLPVPYFVFGDREPFVGCIEYVDRAFDWAEKHGIQILLDLHTVPHSQNGYDNGGITGVCKWCHYPDEVEFALTVLERLSERYGKRRGLYGIEVLNEPISWIVYITAPSTGKADDKEEAKGSGYVPMPFLREFYTRAYQRMRVFLPKDKTIVFHDGFRFTAWNRFFRESKFENVALDTHIYIFAMENFVPIRTPWVYQRYVNINRRALQRVQKDVRVIVGEWCISNRYAIAGKTPEERKKRFNEIAAMQLSAWNEAYGWFYWNYQLLRDRTTPTDELWKESWDLCRCVRNGWIDPKTFQQA